MGFLLFVLEVVKQKTFQGTFNLEIFAGIVGVLFLITGIWLGHNGSKKPTVEPFKDIGSGLSKRETEVLQLMAQGLSNQEIADTLFVSLNTVKTHISNIYTKLNVRRRTQAIQKVKNWQSDNHPKG